MPSPFSATRWVLLSSFGYRALAVFGQILIVRVASKELFGSFDALISFPLMLMVLLPLSFDQLLIREKLFARRYLVALAWSLLILGGAATAVTGLIGALALPGGPLEGAFGSEAGPQSLALLAVIFAVFAVKLSIRSILAAELDFKKIAIGEFTNGTMTYFGGAAVILFLPTVDGLLISYLTGELLETLIIYRGRRFRPFAVLAPRRFSTARRLFRKNRWFCLTNTADLTLNNVGSLLPGPLVWLLISEAANADFRVSKILIQLPVLLLTGAIWRVAYPSLSGVDEETLQTRCLRIIGASAAFIAPLVIWLAFFAPSLALIVGGEKYLAAAPLIQWMAAYMILTAIYSPISSLDMLRNRPEIGLYWNIVHTVARLLTIWLAAPHGLLVTVAAMSLVSAGLWLVWAGILGWLLGCGARRYLRPVLMMVPPVVLLSGAFYACSLAPGYLAPLLCSIAPGLIYLAAVWRYYPQQAEMLRRLLTRG